MRWPALLLPLVLGCTTPVADNSPTATTGPDAPLPPDLRTRTTGSDWPGFLGPTGDSVSTEKGILKQWPREGLRIVWEKRVGQGYGMPSISRGRLFLFDRIRDRARLRCFKSESGEELWAFEYPNDYRDKYSYSNGPRCCPVVDRDRVYIFGAEGLLHCLRAEDGKLIWKVDTAREFGVVQNFFGVGSTPVIEGDLLIAMIGGSPKGSADVPFEELKGNGSGVVAFDKYTGKVRWKASDELASYAGPALATVDGRRWCFVFARGGLVGLEPATGKVDFHYPWRADLFESVNASNPVVVGKRVLLTECYQLGAALLEVGPGACKEVWTERDKGARAKSLMCHWNTPLHVDGYVYGSSGRHTNEAELRCVELATGKVVWREPGLSRCSLLLVDGHFVCLGEYGTLHLIRVNPHKFEEVAQVTYKDPAEPGEPEVPNKVRYPAWAAPALAHGLLYVRGEGRVLCLELIPKK